MRYLLVLLVFGLSVIFLSACQATETQALPTLVQFPTSTLSSTNDAPIESTATDTNNSDASSEEQVSLTEEAEQLSIMNETEAETWLITAVGVIAYECPAEDCDAVELLNIGTYFIPLETSDGWHKIDLTDTTAYILAEYTMRIDEYERAQYALGLTPTLTLNTQIPTNIVSNTGNTNPSNNNTTIDNTGTTGSAVIIGGGINTGNGSANTGSPNSGGNSSGGNGNINNPPRGIQPTATTLVVATAIPTVPIDEVGDGSPPPNNPPTEDTGGLPPMNPIPSPTLPNDLPPPIIPTATQADTNLP